jgi:replicative DNA helicase
MGLSSGPVTIENTTGALFLSKVIEERGPLSFLSAFRLQPKFFTEEEKKIIKMMSAYVDVYKTIPGRNIVEVETNFIIPDCPSDGDIKFWADEVRKRYSVETSYSMCKNMLSVIAEGDIEDAYNLGGRLQQVLAEGRSGTRVYTLEDTVDEVLKIHDESQLNIKNFGIPFGIPFLDKVSGGAQGGDLITAAGLPGCLTGDTILCIQRGKRVSYRPYDLKTIYHKFNGIPFPKFKRGIVSPWRGGKNIPTYILSCGDTGKIIKNRIGGVLYSGTKEVYKLETQSGKSIKATGDHLFLTSTTDREDKAYTKLDNLRVGDHVVSQTKLDRGARLSLVSTKKRRIVRGIPFHPFAQRDFIGKKDYKRIPFSHCVIEASMNNLPVEEFINIIKHEEEQARELKYLETPKQCVHHINGDRSDDRLENLEILSNAQHSYVHGKTTSFDINGIRGVPDKIISITRVGEEDTYDVVMEEEPFNFKANGIFVHNSAKTFLLLHMAISAHNMGKVILFIPTEMSEIQYHRRAIALRNNLSINRIKFGKLSSIIGKPIIEYDKQMIADMPNKFYLTDASLSLGVADVKSAAYIYKPDAIYIDGAYLLRPETYAKTRYEIVSSVAESLKILAKELNIPVFATYQLNKRTDDIYQSAVIRQLSSIVLEISDYDEVESEVWGAGIKPKVINITKGRDGEEGQVVILLDTNHTRIIQSEDSSDDME